MNRLTSGTVSLFALLLVGACNNDPTSDTNNDQVAQINASPSTLNVTHGKVSKFQVSAVNEAGNPVSAAYELKSVGPGITVTRDSSFFPIFVGDNNTLTVPPAATTFQYNVTGNDLVSTSITVTAAGKDVTIPVIVLPDPASDTTTTASVTQSGSAATDTITATLPAPYIFQNVGSVSFAGAVGSVSGNGVTVNRSADGSTIKLLALPGSTGNGTVSGFAIGFASNIPLTNPITTGPVTVDATAPAPMAGTDDPTTAPTIDLSSGVGGVLDGGSFGAASCGQNSGAPCQLYKFTVPADTNVHVRLQWDNDADLGLYFINAADLSDSDQLCDANGRASAAPEECDLTFPAGDYYAAVVSFGPFYPENDPNPDWVAVQLALTP
jgi:Bacterial pre-peptidase C-terminal domain